jgi:subtilisin family serine protease
LKLIELEEKKVKRKINRKKERMVFLLLAIILLAVTIERAETIWPANQNNQSGNTKPRTRVRAESEPNDPSWNLQWSLRKIEADWAWNATVGSSDVLVAIIDSGIDYNHPDLAANYVGLGHDWINNDEDPMDDYNHGTKVAGIIAAQINNEVGIAGLAQVKIMAEKVLDNNGEGHLDQLANGIKHATDQGAKIISMSLSVPENDSLLYEAVKYAYGKGILLVAAAGNEASDAKRYPAAYDEVIAVTATNESDQIYPFSNYGNWIELAAPGVDIFTTDLFDKNLPPDYQYYRWGTGTSFACPHVSGLAALLWSEFPNATRDWIRTRLRETADDLGAPGFDNYYGYGRINARKAIYEASPANYTLTITTTMNGTTNPAPGAYTYPNGTVANVKATPNADYTFDHWELDGVNVGSTNPITITMDANHTLHAAFEGQTVFRAQIFLEGPFWNGVVEYWIVQFDERRPVRLISNYY